MEIPQQIPTNQLVTFSKEHLYYEIFMLYGATETLVKGTKNVYVHNALLESFVIHASNILDFFYKPQIKEDDVKAIHFMKDVKAWRAALPPITDSFKQFNKKRNKWVMHLSYKRLDVGSDQRGWGSPRITKQIKKLVDLFLDSADPKRIHSQLHEFHSQSRKNKR